MSDQDTSGKLVYCVLCLNSPEPGDETHHIFSSMEKAEAWAAADPFHECRVEDRWNDVLARSQPPALARRPAMRSLEILRNLPFHQLSAAEREAAAKVVEDWAGSCDVCDCDQVGKIAAAIRRQEETP